MKFVPHQYQENSIMKMVNSPHVALFADPGLGKTVITLSALLQIRKVALVVAPLEIVYRVWPREIAKWDHTAKIKYAILHGPDKEANLRSRKAIYIINPDGLKWLYKTCKKLRYFPFDVLVVDESTEFKSYKSKRFTDHLCPMLPAFSHRYILSGTPITRSYLDLWSQYFILDIGRRLGDNYYHYRGKYFYRADHKGYDWKPFPDHEEKIRNQVADITIRISGKDHLDLPEVVIDEMRVTLPQSSRAVYKEMAKELLVEFEDGTEIDAANAAVKSNKLHCIANGFLYVSGVHPKTGKKIVVDTKYLHNAKIDALESLVNSLDGSPLLVGFHYKADLKKLLNRFPKTPYFATDVSRQQKQQIENAWNKGKLPLLFAQIHSTARGLNLQESGNHVAFYSLTWPWDDYEQFIGRVARQGQKSSHVFVHAIIGEKTVDELIMERLRDRGQQSEEFLNHFRKHLQDAAA
jgi:SNF2 family DNA or RNA helicase